MQLPWHYQICPALHCIEGMTKNHVWFCFENNFTSFIMLKRSSGLLCGCRDLCCALVHLLSTTQVLMGHNLINALIGYTVGRNRVYGCYNTKTSQTPHSMLIPNDSLGIQGTFGTCTSSEFICRRLEMTVIIHLHPSLVAQALEVLHSEVSSRMFLPCHLPVIL